MDSALLTMCTVCYILGFCICRYVKQLIFNLIYLFNFFVFFFFFRATPTVYGGSQARGQTGAGAASLYHSHSNMGSEPRLRPTPQLAAMFIFIFLFLSSVVILKVMSRSSHHGSVETNLTSIHEDEGSIPGLD